MKPAQARELFKLMKQFGVEHFRSEALEIKMKPEAPAEVKPSAQGPVSKRKVPASNAIPVGKSDVPHHLSETARLLKLSDADLVDAMFPEGPKAVSNA